MENSVNTSNLTDTERVVVELLCGGRSEKEIANELHVSANTINNHTKSIRRKLGVNKNMEILLYRISEYNGKEFNLKKIREVGISVILIVVNICDFVKPV